MADIYRSHTTARLLNVASDDPCPAGWLLMALRQRADLELVPEPNI